MTEKQAQLTGAAVGLAAGWIWWRSLQAEWEIRAANAVLSTEPFVEEPPGTWPIFTGVVGGLLVGGWLR